MTSAGSVSMRRRRRQLSPSYVRGEGGSESSCVQTGERKMNGIGCSDADAATLLTERRADSQQNERFVHSLSMGFDEFLQHSEWFYSDFVNVGSRLGDSGCSEGTAKTAKIVKT